jgi:hypothetical protein
MLLQVLLACSASHGVRPIGQGNHAVEVSAGGPVARLGGLPVPIPMSTVGYRYGLSDRSDLHVRMSPTPLILFGVVGGDAGVSYMLWDQSGAWPMLVVDHSVHVSGGAGGVRFFGEVEPLLSWQWGQRQHISYVGADVFLQPYDLIEEDPSAPDTRHILAGPLVGSRWMLTERVGLVTQVTWMEPWSDVTPLTAYYYTPFQRGALQVKLGAHVAFGRSK